ncbi:MAG: hypothetical protein NC192_07310, partial [Muribaculaceae bacterium]|nr:hypothetical protein [Muribaculaceae bacterium]
ITSLIFEIPSGALADVFGRKKKLIVSVIMQILGNIAMILSDCLFMVCISISFQALGYNFSSGTGDALAYDSLKTAEMESVFEKFMSNRLAIYRLCGGISTLCAGFALFIGHRLAYGADLIMCGLQIAVLTTLREIYPGDGSPPKRGLTETFGELAACFWETFYFLKKAKNAILLMLCNSLVGAADVLLLFFLQAKLQEKLPQWGLGFALLFMELGGIAASKLILKLPKFGYKSVFTAAALLVTAGILAEHSAAWTVAVLGGFLAAAGDDALQVRTNAVLQDMFPSEQRATLTSAESFSFSVIMVVLSPIAGFVFTYW